jgi:hypothetical protein
MEKEFVPYELALELKELGFDEICPTKYGMTSLKLYENWKPYRNSDDIYEGKFFCNDLCAAPLYQQAFRWFREKYNMVGEINSYYSDKKWSFNYDIVTIYKEKASDRFNTYEEAELECLLKLIEIVKEK